MIKARKRPAGSPRWISVGFIIQGIASIFGLATMIYLAVAAVQSGRGMETYHTAWLVEENSIGFLVFVGCGIAALILAAAFRFRDYLQQRSFEKKLEGRRKNG